MPDLTPRQPRLVGHMSDATGRSVAIFVDRDVVVIRWSGQDIRLGLGQRDTFMRLFMTAERQAEDT